MPDQSEHLSLIHIFNAVLTNMKKIDDELEQVQGELAAQMKELKAEDDTVMASLNRLIEMVGR